MLTRQLKLLLLSCAYLCLGFQSGAAHEVSDVVRFLLVGDPFGGAIDKVRHELHLRWNSTLDLEIVGYNEVRQLALLNAQDMISNYDVIAFDALWMGEYVQKQVLLPLDDYIAQSERVQVDDFLEVAYLSASDDGQQYGLPIQPHPELLWVNTEVFERYNLAYPQTTQDLLETAGFLNEQNPAMQGICWNGQRRQALGQQMAHFYAAFGQAPLDAQGRPQLDGVNALAAAEYALNLVAYSPPDILTMAWDQRVLSFINQRCAMTYEWGARAYLTEGERSTVRGKVVYLPAPHAPSAEAVTPLGTWHVGIPANIGGRADLAWSILEDLTSTEVLRLLAEHGNGGMPRYSLLHDSGLQERYPAFQTVLELSETGQLADWMRPAVPEWAELEIILGTSFHDMLRGQLSAQEAVSQAQQRATALLKAN